MSSLFESSEIKTISILGCGWLGTALAQHFLANDYQVKGSTTRESKVPKLRELGITTFKINLVPEPEGDRINEFLDCDLLIISIPPGTRSGMVDSYHPTQLKYLVKHIEKSRVNKVIYISSTSVYEENRKQATEADEIKPKERMNRAIVMAEEVLSSQHIFSTTILRCGGLLGYDRIPGKYFAGEKNLDFGDVPVNYVHRDDVIGVIDALIQQSKWNETFNVVAPLHPTRKEVYQKNADTFNFEEPEFVPNEEIHFKIVSSYKLLSELNYHFKYPDPLEFAYDKILK